MRPIPPPVASLVLLSFLPLAAACATAPRAWNSSILPPGYVFPAEPDKGSLGLFAVSQQEDLARCHRDFVMKKTPASGRTVIEFTIRPDGATEGVRLVETTLDDPGSVDCMVKSVAAWQTPFRPAAPRQFRYPYTSVAEELSGKVQLPR